MGRSGTYGRYLLHVVLFVVLFGATVAATSIIIDPYFVFGQPSRPGFNSIRVDAVNHPEISKLYSINNQVPRTIIFGSSRAQIGLNPDHAGFAARPVYNAAIGGISMFLMLRYFQHALAVIRPQQVILTVDFFQFDTRAPSSEAGLERLAVTLDGQPTPRLDLLRQRLRDLRFAALSANAVASSWNTLAESMGLRRTMKWVTHANGHNVLIHRVPFSSYSTFETTERAFLHTIWSPRFCLVRPETGYSELDHFRQFVRLAHQRGVDLRILVSPAHAGLWETIAQAGLWEKWEHWKRRLTRIVQEEAGSGSTFPLWDFSGYHFMSTAPVPPPDSVEPMRWYIDANHYTSEAGDLVLNVVFGLPDTGGEIAGEFGVRLSQETIEAHLAGVRSGREKWRAMFPAHAARIKSFADEVTDIRINNASCSQV